MISEISEEKGSPPEFIKVPHQVVAREHDRAQFLVKVVGVPKPTGKALLSPDSLCVYIVHLVHPQSLQEFQTLIL